MKKNKNTDTVKKILLILLGNLCVAGAVVFFIKPSGFITGGATGIALLIEQYLHIPIAYGIAVICIILLLIGWAILGKGFAATTALSAISYPAFVWIFEFIENYIHFTTENMFLNLAFATLLFGYGTAQIMRQGASSGGLDAIAVILYEKKGVPLAPSVAILEVLSMATQVIYSTSEEIMGGILLAICYTALMNHFIAKGSARVELMVYSSKYEEINEYISNTLNRGSSLFRIQGGYFRKESFALQTIVTHRELFKLKEAVLKIDPYAFLTISEMSQVNGRGFTLEHEYLEKPKVKKSNRSDCD